MTINIIAAYMIAVLSIESIKRIITQITDPLVIYCFSIKV